MGIRLKTFGAVMLVNILAVVLLAMFLQYRAASFFEEQYMASLYERAKVGGQNVDGVFQEVYRAALDVAYDERVAALAAGNRQEQMELAEILREYKRNTHMADMVYCFLPEQGILIKSAEHNGVQQLPQDVGRKWLEILHRQHGMHPLAVVDILSTSHKNVYLYSAEIKGKEGETVAWLAFTVSERELYYSYFDSVDNSSQSFALLFDDGKSVSSGPQKLDEAEKEQLASFCSLGACTGRVEMGDASYFGAKAQMPFSGDTYCVLIPEEPFERQTQDLWIMGLLGMLIVLLTTSLGGYVLSSRLSSPVEELALAMQAAGKGDLAARSSVKGNDEIGYLAMTFNGMLEKISLLVEEIANEKALKKEAELKALQYQIRPHFIYNMMNSIRLAAIMQGAGNLGSLLLDFAELLRASINRDGAFVTVEEEITILKHYISLQKFRMMDAFSIDFEIDKETLSCIMPRLILQPLVENSIIHGPSQAHPACTIWVRAFLDEGQLILEVEDDGQGMSPEKLAEIGREQVEKSHGGLSGVGVKNVKERLELYYGAAGRLEYFSDGAKCTLARVSLPVSKDAQAYEL